MVLPNVGLRGHRRPSLQRCAALPCPASGWRVTVLSVSTSTSMSTSMRMRVAPIEAGEAEGSTAGEGPTDQTQAQTLQTLAALDQTLRAFVEATAKHNEMMERRILYTVAGE